MHTVNKASRASITVTRCKRSVQDLEKPMTNAKCTGEINVTTSFPFLRGTGGFP